MRILVGHYIDGTITPDEAESLLAFLREHPHWNNAVKDQLFADRMVCTMTKTAACRVFGNG